MKVMSFFQQLPGVRTKAANKIPKRKE